MIEKPMVRTYIVETQGPEGIVGREERAFTAADAIAQVTLDLQNGFPVRRVYRVRPKEDPDAEEKGEGPGENWPPPFRVCTDLPRICRCVNRGGDEWSCV